MLRSIRTELLASLIAIVVLTLALGLVYPLVVTGIGQVVFPHAADGNQVKVNGQLVGSRLLGQSFEKPVLGRDGKPRIDADGNPLTRPDPRYFQSRPSGDKYNPSATAFSNAGPNGKDTEAATAARADAYLALEKQYDRGLTRGDIPPDAVQTSASGVDPQISPANAKIQAHRIAAVRHLSLSRVDQLIDDHTDGRGLGVLGEPGVNVLELNLALNGETTR
jgi:potassium-transporting ATPase KdpC subunit